jgi:hypothetical protein
MCGVITGTIIRAATFGKDASRRSPLRQTNTCWRCCVTLSGTALRAILVKRAEDWPWSSLRWWKEPTKLPFLDPGPVPRSDNWLEVVQEPHTEGELERLRRSAQRGQPYGGHSWAVGTAKALGLETTLMPVGRPRKPTGGEEGEAGLLFG